jgi:hypothetical protein
MIPKTLDELGYTYAVCNRLLKQYRNRLAEKQIWGKGDLIQIIKIDLEKIAQALFEVKNRNVHRVLSDFFDEDEAIVPKILPKLKGQHLYHVGFEIYEPLDLILFGLQHWFEKTKQTFGADIKVSHFLRFPASEAFQNRVKAYVEIMRIWIEVDGRELMLELFDIHRPVDAVVNGSNDINNRSLKGLFTDEGFPPNHSHLMARLFGKDQIWHYAAYIDSAESVRQLHDDFKIISNGNGRYTLCYESVVHNRDDGSYHTKLINNTRGLEIEFVTQLATSDDTVRVESGFEAFQVNFRSELGLWPTSPMLAN